MILLTLPLTIVTLGLFLLVVNALSLGIVVALTPMATTGCSGARAPIRSPGGRAATRCGARPATTG